jgi:hypothetical protein
LFGNSILQKEASFFHAQKRVKGRLHKILYTIVLSVILHYKLILQFTNIKKAQFLSIKMRNWALLVTPKASSNGITKT